MRVFVVMGNDYPDSVFSTETWAQAYVDAKKNADDYLNKYGTPRIYWRVYDFDLNGRAAT